MLMLNWVTPLPTKRFGSLPFDELLPKWFGSLPFDGEGWGGVISACLRHTL
jgi:hypothetical protein